LAVIPVIAAFVFHSAYSAEPKAGVEAGVGQKNRKKIVHLTREHKF
jgi:hypothetical protein